MYATCQQLRLVDRLYARRGRLSKLSHGKRPATQVNVKPIDSWGIFATQLVNVGPIDSWGIFATPKQKKKGEDRIRTVRLQPLLAFPFHNIAWVVAIV